MGILRDYRTQKQASTGQYLKKADMINNAIPCCIHKTEEVEGTYEGRPTHEWHYHYVAVWQDKVYKGWFSLPYNQERTDLINYLIDNQAFPLHGVLLTQSPKNRYISFDESEQDICPCSIADGMAIEKQEARRQAQEGEPAMGHTNSGSEPMVTQEQLEVIADHNKALWDHDMPTVQLTKKQTEGNMTYAEALNVIGKQETLLRSVLKAGAKK